MQQVGQALPRGSAWESSVPYTPSLARRACALRLRLPGNGAEVLSMAPSQTAIRRAAWLLLLLLENDQSHVSAPAFDLLTRARESERAPVFIDADFVQLYQQLLIPGIPAHKKAEQWSRLYRQRWVRWTGQLAYVHESLLRFRQTGATATYDVVLRIAKTSSKPVPALVPGRFYAYSGRLEHYDDLFRILYLDSGTVFDTGAQGVPGTLAQDPEMTRHEPDPPAEDAHFLH